MAARGGAADPAVQKSLRRALVIVICVHASGCADEPAPRPLANGFAAGAGVADPYTDGKRHLADGNYELAVQRFGEALAHDRRSLDALNGLAIAYTRLGRFDSAETQFERALQIAPTSAATLNNYGWSLIEQGRLREARAFLELARRYATEAEAPVITTNLQNLGRAQPPALLGALEEGSAAPTSPGGHRLIRVGEKAYRLETRAQSAAPTAPSPAPDTPPGSIALHQDAAAMGPSEKGPARPDSRPAPSLATQGAGATGVLSPAMERSQAAEPQPSIAIKPHARRGPIRLWPPLASGSEARPIITGDEE
jgi:tetratricopeptide (TPR) repeat protein